jgi:hypothetical protein
MAFHAVRNSRFVRRNVGAGSPLSDWHARRNTDPTMSTIRLAKTMAAAAIWTFAVWGNRTLLVRQDEGYWASGRIVILLSLGIVLGLAARLVHQNQATSRFTQTTIAAFAVGMTLTWVPSLFRIILSDEAAAFKAVHTVLAGTSLGFAFILSRQIRM